MDRTGVLATYNEWIKQLNGLDKYMTESQKKENDTLKSELGEWKKKMGKTVEKSEVDERQRVVDAWVAYIEPVGIFSLVSMMMLTLTLMYVLQFTPLSYITFAYISTIPLVLKVQGELWKNGWGQYVRLESRDRIDIMTLAVITVLSYMGLYAMKQQYNKDFTWFITAVVVYTFILNTVGAHVVYWVVNKLKQMFIDEETELQQAEMEYTYGWNYIHLPIIITFFASVLGGVVMSSLNFVGESTSV